MASKRWISVAHTFLTLAQVGMALLFVRLELLPLALLAALAGKWRVVSSHPYRLWRNLRANSCDIIVITAGVLSMDFYRASTGLMIGFALFLLVWLLLLKPAESRLAVAIQAACCQFLGLSVVWLYGLERGLSGFVAIVLAAAIAYSAARHLSLVVSEDNSPERRILPFIWTALIIQLAWLSWLWAVTYRLPGGLLIPQISLLSTILGFFAVQAFFSDAAKRRRLSSGLIWQQVFFCLIMVLAIVIMTPWTSG